MTDIYQHFKDNFILNYTSETPLYKQLENYIISQIRIGTFKEGDKMISENEICQLFDISRTTVRQAMNSLFDKGVISRVRGKGTFVTGEKIQRNISNLYHYSESIMALGLEPSSEVMEAKIIVPNANIVKLLQLKDEHQKVFKLTRLRKADDMPLIMEISYVPYYLCQGIENINFEHRSLYNVLEKIYQLKLKYAEETMEAVLVDNPRTQKLLQVEKGSPAFHIDRLAYLEDGNIMQYSTSILRADKCTFKITLTGGKKEDISLAKSYNF